MAFQNNQASRYKNSIRQDRQSRISTQTKTPKIVYSYQKTPIAHEAPFKENMVRGYKNSGILPNYGRLTKRSPQPSHYNPIRRFNNSQPDASTNHKFPLSANQTRTVFNSAPGGRPYGGGI